MTNEQRQMSITKKIINGKYKAGQEIFCEFCYSCRDTFVGWDKKQCIKAGGLPNACHLCCLCAKAYNRMQRRIKCS